MSPYTIADVVNVVIAAGGRPDFVDVELSTGNMDPECLRRKIDRKVGAVLVTHLHGIAAQIQAIQKICEEPRVPLIEDAAQALGASVGGRRLGTFGIAGVYSFGTYKNINAWFGGMVVTKDSTLAENIRAEIAEWPLFSSRRILGKILFSSFASLLSWGPVFRPFVHRIFRYGFLNDIESINRIVAIELDTSRRDYLPDFYETRLTPGQARWILAQWPTLDSHNQKRIEYAAIYSAGLSKPPAPDSEESIYTYYPLQAEARTAVLKHLMFHRRDVAAQHLKNCAHLGSFQEFYSSCPIAEKVARSVILLPTYPSYGADEVYKNIEVLNKIPAASATR